MNTNKEYTALEAANAIFNNELERHIDGTLPKNHIYQLGNPGKILLSAGIEDLPVSLGADRLINKANPNYKNNHPFSLSDVKDLPKAINNPIAVFDNVTGDVSKVILTELQDKKGSNFVAALKIRTGAEGRKNSATVNEIKTIYPKDRAGGVLEWIVSKNNSLRYVNKEKALNFISSQPSNPTVGGDNAQGINSKLINSAINKITNFQNPDPIYKITYSPENVNT